MWSQILKKRTITLIVYMPLGHHPPARRNSGGPILLSATVSGHGPMAEARITFSNQWGKSAAWIAREQWVCIHRLCRPWRQWPPGTGWILACKRKSKRPGLLQASGGVEHVAEWKGKWHLVVRGGNRPRILWGNAYIANLATAIIASSRLLRLRAQLWIFGDSAW